MSPLYALPLAAVVSVEGLGAALLICLGIALFAVLLIWLVKMFITDPQTLKAVSAILGVMAIVACVVIFFRYL